MANDNDSRVRFYRFMGWTEMSVCAEGQLSEPPEVELETRLRDYRLCGTDWQESLAAFKVAVATLPNYLTPSLIAFAMHNYLPGFTPKFIQWIAAQADEGMLAKELTSRFESNVKGYRESLTNKLGRQANTGRMVQNWAVPVTTYQMLRRFMAELGCDEALPSWQDSIVETVKAVQQERAGQVFIGHTGAASRQRGTHAGEGYAAAGGTSTRHHHCRLSR